MRFRNILKGWRNWRYWPLVNFFTTVFSVEPPSAPGDDPTAGVKALLEVIALVATLMLTMACAVPTAVSFDELAEADARWVHLFMHDMSGES